MTKKTFKVFVTTSAIIAFVGGIITILDSPRTNPAKTYLLENLSSSVISALCVSLLTAFVFHKISKRLSKIEKELDLKNSDTTQQEPENETNLDITSQTILLGITRGLNREISEQMQFFSAMLNSIVDIDFSNQNLMAVLTQFLTQIKDEFASASNMEKDELNCSFKVFSVNEDGKRVSITIARSKSNDERGELIGKDHIKLVESSTLSCALLGLSDSITDWNQRECFSCTDVPKHHKAGTLRSNRDTPSHYYKSNLVFPLKHLDMNNAQTQPKTLTFGFLSFDSPSINGFNNAPDIFDFREQDQKAKYKTALNQCASYHYGALISNMLSMSLSPFCQRLITETNELNNSSTDPIQSTS